MSDARNRLFKEFRAYLKAQGLKSTKQREAIAEVFFVTERHLSLNDVLERTQRTQPSVGYATVYRTMKLMTEAGVANEHKFADNDLALYEPNIEDGHHDHLICVDCGRIIEFEDELIEKRQDDIAEREGFVVQKHRLEIYGSCQRKNCEYRH